MCTEAVGAPSPAPQSLVVLTLKKQWRAPGHLLSLHTEPQGGPTLAWAQHPHRLDPCTECPQMHLSAHQKAVQLLVFPLGWQLPHPRVRERTGRVPGPNGGPEPGVGVGLPGGEALRGRLDPSPGEAARPRPVTGSAGQGEGVDLPAGPAPSTPSPRGARPGALEHLPRGGAGLRPGLRQGCAGTRAPGAAGARGRPGPRDPPGSRGPARGGAAFPPEGRARGRARGGEPGQAGSAGRRASPARTWARPPRAAASEGRGAASGALPPARPGGGPGAPAPRPGRARPAPARRRPRPAARARAPRGGREGRSGEGRGGPGRRRARAGPGGGAGGRGRRRRRPLPGPTGGRAPEAVPGGWASWEWHGRVPGEARGPPDPRPRARAHLPAGCGAPPPAPPSPRSASSPARPARPPLPHCVPPARPRSLGPGTPPRRGVRGG